MGHAGQAALVYEIAQLPGLLHPKLVLLTHGDVPEHDNGPWISPSFPYIGRAPHSSQKHVPCGAGRTRYSMQWMASPRNARADGSCSSAIASCVTGSNAFSARRSESPAAGRPRLSR